MNEVSSLLDPKERGAARRRQSECQILGRERRELMQKSEIWKTPPPYVEYVAPNCSYVELSLPKNEKGRRGEPSILKGTDTARVTHRGDDTKLS